MVPGQGRWHLSAEPRGGSGPLGLSLPQPQVLVPGSHPHGGHWEAGLPASPRPSPCRASLIDRVSLGTKPSLSSR